jgi:hypothetical protein
MEIELKGDRAVIQQDRVETLIIVIHPYVLR